MVMEKRIEDPHTYGDFDQAVNISQWRVFSTNGTGVIRHTYTHTKK